MTEPNLDVISDGGELRRLPGGLVIIRRMKHEWRDELDTMAPDKLLTRTGKKWGSKFFKTWPPRRLADWMAAEIAQIGWQRGNGPLGPLDIRMEEPIGLADGQKVHTIRIVCDGHYAHAYPIKD